MDVDLATGDASEPNVLDPYGQVYANVPSETHMLAPMENCEHCMQRSLGLNRLDSVVAVVER